MSLSPSEPQQLIIPKLQLRSPIESVGQTSSGDMASPDKAMGVGWYRLGYLPGSLGNSVLAAHSMHTSGKGAFYSLDMLEPGDEIVIRTVTSLQKYIVTHRETLVGDDTTLENVFGPGQHANLNLITCSGVWDDTAKRYPDRLVVFSRFDSEKPLLGTLQ